MDIGFSQGYYLRQALLLESVLILILMDIGFSQQIRFNEDDSLAMS